MVYLQVYAGSELQFLKCVTQEIISCNKLHHLNDIILKNQPNLLLVPSKASDIFSTVPVFIISARAPIKQWFWSWYMLHQLFQKRVLLKLDYA